MGKSKFTQQEISAARRVYNHWQATSPEMNWPDFLAQEIKEGFSDSVYNTDVPPFKIVIS